MPSLDELAIGVEKLTGFAIDWRVIRDNYPRQLPHNAPRRAVLEITPIDAVERLTQRKILDRALLEKARQASTEAAQPVKLAGRAKATQKTSRPARRRESEPEPEPAPVTPSVTERIVATEGSVAAAKILSRARKVALSVLPTNERVRTEVDDRKIDFIILTRNRYRALGNDMPPLEVHGPIVRHRDPLEDLLNDNERNGMHNELGDGQRHNWMEYKSAQIAQIQSGQRRPRKLSKQLRRKIQRMLASLWLAPEKCWACWETLEHGLYEEAGLVVTGQMALPGEAPRGRMRRFVYPEIHRPVCQRVQEEIAKFLVAHPQTNVAPEEMVATLLNLFGTLKATLVPELCGENVDEDERQDEKVVIHAIAQNLRIIARLLTGVIDKNPGEKNGHAA